MKCNKKHKIFDEWTPVFELICKMSTRNEVIQNDLIILQNAFCIGKRLCELKAEVVDYLASYTARVYLSHLVYEIEKIKLMFMGEKGAKREALVSSSRIEEIVVDVRRIENIFTYYKYKHTFEMKSSSWKLENESIINKCFDQLDNCLVNSHTEFKNEKRVKEIFTELKQLIELKISERLRLEVT